MGFKICSNNTHLVVFVTFDKVTYYLLPISSAKIILD